MQSVLIGTIIKQRRKDLKLTQEQLCSGICDPVSLSRIETGKQVPSRSIVNALLQRLGLPDTRYYALSSKHELEIEALKKKLLHATSLVMSIMDFKNFCSWRISSPLMIT